MQDDRWSKEDEDLPVMALSLSGVAFQCHIKITVPKQATNPEKGSFPWVRESWWGSRKSSPRPLMVLLISQLRCYSHATLAVMNYFSSGENNLITHLICHEPVTPRGWHFQACQKLQSDLEIQTKDRDCGRNVGQPIFLGQRSC